MRNSLRPVNRLPPEILASCATFVSDNDPRPIVPLTHVCQYWQRSICSDPRSWASISTAWKRLAPLSLERAGAVLLTVDITVSDIKGSEGFLESFLPHISKISSLRVAGCLMIEVVANDLPGFFDSPMPNLTSLELQQAAEPSETFPSGGTPPLLALENVLKVRSLRLTRTPIYPTLFRIASLRELQLVGYANPFDFSTFIGLLRSNLNLESIVLDIGFVADPAEMGTTRKVPLSRLQRLSIACAKAIDSKGLLSCISFPRGVQIEVESTEWNLSASLGSFLPSPPTSIHDLVTPITTIKIQTAKRELQFFGNGSSFTFRSSRSPLNAHEWLALFPTVPVRELQINIHRHGITAAGLSNVMKRLPALETLAISKGAVSPAWLVFALTEQPVLCPALKTVALFDCDVGSDFIRELEKAMANRGNLTAAQVYRVVIVNSAGTTTLEFNKSESLFRAYVRVDEKLLDLT